MKKIIVSVINDLVTDQRVNKFCTTLHESGYDILVVGRKLKNSLPLEKKPYRMHRMKLLFNKGPLFYAEFNLRLFFFLLFKKADILFSNDLDTLLPNYLVSKIKSKKLVYDSHEYFCYVPELINRPFVQKIWLSIEKWIFPKLENVFTVNDSIAEKYFEEYNVKAVVVRNVPSKKQFLSIPHKTKAELGIIENKWIIILQGAGININRGAEEAVQALKYVDNAIFYIIGGGDVLEKLKNMTAELKLRDRIIFKNKMPFAELIQYTRNADIGLTLDKADNPNYEMSLPNKIFDYIHSGIPVLASPLAEIQKVYSQYNIGEIIESHEPKHIAEKINYMLTNKQKQAEWRENTKFALEIYNWENESEKIFQIFQIR